jgi:TolB-like protein/Tfp pilus assembly protein PilF
MGEVYRARDTKLQRDVAVKVLPELLAKDPDALARFEREALAVAALSHPNILAIHDFGTQEGTAYAVMELLEGETLRGRLAAGPIPQKQAVDYGLQIARGLSAAHERGVVHRDLKPENLFVTRDGHVKILDFGLAKRMDVVAPGEETSAPTRSGHTEPGTVMGTVGYMSPEQVKGLAIDHRSDVFSFGAILYEMLSGKRAFRRDTNAETMAAIMRDEPPELSESGRNIPVALDHIVKHCLEKNRENRFQSARDIAFALSEASGSTAVASGPQVVAPAGGRRPVWVAAMAMLVLVAAGALLLRRSHGRPGTESGGARRIAVLPFENLGAAEDDYFADGIADAVRGKLTGMPGVQVIARGSSTPYKKTNKTPDQIAKELNVGYLLTATVRWQKAAGSNRVEVTPELVEIASGSPTSKWQQPFEAALTDVFKVQSDIATQVAQALGVALGAAEEKRLSEKPTSNLAAYDAFLKGGEAEKNFYYREARDAYQRAVSLDPKFAMAMLGLARFSSDPEEQLALIRRAAQEKGHLTEREGLLVEFALAGAEHRPEDRRKAAQQLHAKYPDEPTSARFLAQEERAKGNSDAAIKIYEELLAVDPRNSDAYNQIGYVYGTRGDYEKSIDNLRKYQALVGDKANPYDSFGEIQANSGHYTEAIENLNRAIAIKPDLAFAYEHMGVAYEGMGDTANAIRSYDRAAELSDSDDARRDFLFGTMNAALIGKDLVAMRGALDRIAKIPEPREWPGIIPEWVAVLRDIADGRAADAQRRLVEFKPRLEARWEENHRSGNVSASFKPYFPPWNFLMGTVLESQGRLDEALKFYEINADPPNPPLNFQDRRWTLEARAKVAEIVARKGDLARAEKLLAENRKWNPGWAPNRPSELEVERLKQGKTGRASP